MHKIGLNIFKCFSCEKKYQKLLADYKSYCSFDFCKIFKGNFEITFKKQQ